MQRLLAEPVQDLVAGVALLASMPPSGATSMIPRMLAASPLLTAQVTWSFISRNFMSDRQAFQRYADVDKIVVRVVVAVVVVVSHYPLSPQDVFLAKHVRGECPALPCSIRGKRKPCANGRPACSSARVSNRVRRLAFQRLWQGA